MDKTKLQNKITKLRKEIRNDYDKIGILFYEIIKELDDYLEYLNKGLEKNGKKN